MSYPQTPFTKYPDIVKHLKRQSNTICQSDLVENLLEWLCTTPRVTTFRVNLLKTTTEEITNYINNELVKQKYSNIEIPRIITHLEIPELVGINSLAKITFPCLDDTKEIIVDVTCGAAVLRGAHIFAPGVLAMMAGTQIDEIVKIYADLEGKCKKGTNIKYESNEKLFLGIGRVKMQRYEIYKKNNETPNGIAIELMTTISGVPSLGNAYLNTGTVIMQNLPSIVCCHVLKPEINDIILDMCAAPGNKTTHLGELIKNQGLIIAFDKTENKINLITNNCSNNGITCVQTYVQDGTKCLALNTEKSKNTKEILSKQEIMDVLKIGPPYTRGNLFNKILLDAPCSGLGNRPQLKNSISPKMLMSYSRMQRKLFETAVPLLQPGGTLVYSTCTVTEAENEELVKWAINKFDNIELVAADPLLGGSGWPDTGLTEEQRLFVQRFGPKHDSNNIRAIDDLFTDTIGFFIAKFIKKT